MNDKDQTAGALAPLPYHRAVCEFLQSQEPDLWRWFSSDTYSDQLIESQKLELLKSTVRLSPDNHQQLYARATQARDALDIALPITLYQAQSAASGLNAMLYFFPDVIAIILQGDWAKHHSEQELLAVFGHEIAHHKLYTEQDGQFFTTRRILDWCQEQPDCALPYVETCRRYQLFTEVYADLGSLLVTGEWQSSVANLIKVTTGVSEVAVDDYVAQADEVLEGLDEGSRQTSHPETYLRAKILHSLHQAQQQSDWNAHTWQADTQRLVVGRLDVLQLDLLDQGKLTQASLELLNRFTLDSRFQTDTLEALAQEYFADFSRPSKTAAQSQDAISPPSVDASSTDTLAQLVGHCTDKTCEYLCFVLLDFASADPDCEPDSFSHALQIAQELGITETFEPLFRKELKKKKADVAKLLANNAPNTEETKDHE